ncbi:MAG: HesA/MoeB/ThiF family protein [Bacteroidales bacterium]|nr:HesA/MoeB/ThiF family protein [Bacteroidales bacterium]
MLEEKDFLRYSRQIELEGFGVEGQEKLKQAKVLIVGVGGLGSIASLLLVASGVGVIGLIDKDKVSLSNLHRQILYRESQIGEEKVEKAKENLREVNSDCKIICYNEFLSKENAENIIKDYDIVVDCCDNFATRYVINDACQRLKKPFVYSAISDFEGQVALLNCEEDSANYRTFFPEENLLKEDSNKNKAVIGVLPSITASIASNEVIKFLINYTNVSLKNKLLIFNVKNYNFNIFEL